MPQLCKKKNPNKYNMGGKQQPNIQFVQLARETGLLEEVYYVFLTTFDHSTEEWTKFFYELAFCGVLPQYLP